VLDVLHRYQPAVVVLGREFENERHDEIRDLLEVIRDYGGQVVYHAGEVRYASADLLHSTLGELERRSLEQFHAACERQNINMGSLIQRLDAMTGANLLVIGDSIVDQ